MWLLAWLVDCIRCYVLIPPSTILSRFPDLSYIIQNIIACMGEMKTESQNQVKIESDDDDDVSFISQHHVKTENDDDVIFISQRQVKYESDDDAIFMSQRQVKNENDDDVIFLSQRPAKGEAEKSPVTPEPEDREQTESDILREQLDNALTQLIQAHGVQPEAESPLKEFVDYKPASHEASSMALMESATLAAIRLDNNLSEIALRILAVPSVLRTVSNHQLDFVRMAVRLYKNDTGSGICNGDGTGVGKTAENVLLCYELCKMGVKRHLYISANAGLFANIQEEIKVCMQIVCAPLAAQ